MKIFLYSDLHISRTSSIMPIDIDNSKYTFRQQMIINLGKYMSNIIREEKPDLIVNCGDTFDQHVITSYDVDVASEFFKCFQEFNIEHYVLVGNHEMVNQNFNAVALLNNIQGIKVIDEPCTINELAFLPYCNYQEILEFPKGRYLFSHQDIQGSVIRGDFILPEGISPDILRNNYKLVFNGHIHKSSISGNVINLGSISTHSFSDDGEAVPQCYIFDTETLDLKTFRPYICPLFRKFEIKYDITELKSFVENLDPNYKYILHIICPFDIKEQVKTYLDSNSLILNNRLNTKIEKDKNNEDSKEEIINLQSNIDIVQSFKEFLNTLDLKYPKNNYIEVLEGVK